MWPDLILQYFFLVVIKRIHGHEVNATVNAKPFFQIPPPQKIQFMVPWPWDAVMVIKVSWLPGTQNVVRSYVCVYVCVCINMRFYDSKKWYPENDIQKPIPGLL